MKVKRLFILKKEQLPDDWQQRILWLWQEDDAPVPDKEKTNSAFARISNMHHSKGIIGVHDYEDYVYTIHVGGWVRRFDYDGGRVGVLVTEDYL